MAAFLLCPALWPIVGHSEQDVASQKLGASQRTGRCKVCASRSFITIVLRTDPPYRYESAIRDLVIPNPDVDVFDCEALLAGTPRLFTPKSSKDTTLTAFAQLATLRLDASRCMISLIDSDRQYVLAESTKTLSIQSDARHSCGDELWLGSVVISRNTGIYGLALENAIRILLSDSPDEDDTYIIDDLREHPLCAGAPFLTAGPRIRFYAATPLRTSDGDIIGIYCVFDDKLRPGGLTKDEKAFLRDMAKTTVDHLEAQRARTEQARSKRLITALESFVDGLASIRSREQEADNRKGADAENAKDIAMQDVAADAPRPQPPKGAATDLEGGDDDSPGLAPKQLWDLAMPPGSKPMFSRAAKIIQQAANYDGVAFFYMGAQNSQQLPSAPRKSVKASPPTPWNTETLPSPVVDARSSRLSQAVSVGDEKLLGGTDSDDSSATEQPSPRSICPLLSYALSSRASVKSRAGQFPRFERRDMERLIGDKGPRARTFTLNRRNEVLPGDTSSSGSGQEQTAPLTLRESVDSTTSHPNHSEARHLKTQQRTVKSLRKLSADALAYACLPIWDFERSRWLAYCVVWSSSGSRHMKEDGDPSYLRIFGNSIVIALSHIDAIASNRAKSTFVSSMSHELRSPLHGVVSAAKFLQDSTQKFGFQREMADTVSECGHTLLDVLDHLLDHAKISSLAPLQRGSSDPNLALSLQGQTEPSPSALSSVVDLSVLVEEVVETVLMGYSVRHDFVYSDDDPRAASHQGPRLDSTTKSLVKNPTLSRGRVRIVLQLPHRRNWCVRTQTGAWRRIIMNLFGNSIKYTSSGLIIVRIEAPTNDASPMVPVILHIGEFLSNSCWSTVRMLKHVLALDGSGVPRVEHDCLQHAPISSSLCSCILMCRGSHRLKFTFSLGRTVYRNSQPTRRCLTLTPSSRRGGDGILLQPWCCRT